MGTISGVVAWQTPTFEAGTATITHTTPKIMQQQCVPQCTNIGMSSNAQSSAEYGDVMESNAVHCSAVHINKSYTFTWCPVTVQCSGTVRAQH